MIIIVMTIPVIKGWGSGHDNDCDDRDGRDDVVMGVGMWMITVMTVGLEA